MSAKTKTYRSKSERQENSAGMKKGAPLEVYELLTAGEVALTNPEQKVLVMAFGKGEACRDMNDIEGTILEKDITGVFIPMRRAGDPVVRVVQTVVGFVKPTSDPVYKEEHVEKVDHAETKEAEEKTAEAEQKL